MDNSKHTVTIPFKDYEELNRLAAVGNGIGDRVQRHVDLLREAGVEIPQMNVGLEPKNVRAFPGGMGSRNIRIEFEY